jgi:integrase/recombinase XerD
MTREQEGCETRSESHRVKKRLPPERALQVHHLPVVACWLSTIPFSILLSEAANDVGFRAALQAKERDRQRLSLDYYLRPLKESALPGVEALRRYVHEKYRRGWKPNTLRATVGSGKQFLVFLQERGKQSLEALTKEDLEAFVEYEQDRGMKPCTVKTRLAAVYAFVAFLIEQGMLDAVVLTRKIRVKLPESLPRAMDPADVRHLLSVIEHTRDRAMILVLLRTGMRIGEVLNTNVRDVNLAERRIEIPQAPKTRRGRVVYLSDDAREALKVWLAKRDPDKEVLFYGQGRYSMEYAAARMVFKKYLIKAGLADRGYTVHCLRHTFASELLNAGMRLECLQQLLGHTSITVTRRYARLTDTIREEEYFRAMERIEKGAVHGHYQLDPELQAILEEKKLLHTHPNALPQRP